MFKVNKIIDRLSALGIDHSRRYQLPSQSYDEINQPCYDPNPY